MSDPPHAGPPPRASTFRQIIHATRQLDWSQFEGEAALRCTAGVAIVLGAGLAAGDPAISAFGAVGAVSVGFGSFQGAYRSRAAVMVYAAFGMAVSVFAGSLAGHVTTTMILGAMLAAFACGMVVALGQAASFVGMQCLVAVLVAGGFPADANDAALRAAIVLAGGLVQTFLVVMVWPLRRFPAERHALAAVYRSLGTYASAIPAAGFVAPEPHTFAATASPLTDPQPFARVGEVLVFQSLLDEAERIRASLAGLATQRRRTLEVNAICADGLAEHTALALGEIADAIEDGREPGEPVPIWPPLDDCARQLPDIPIVGALLGQIRSAWQTAAVMTPARVDAAAVGRFRPLRRRPPIRDGLTTLRANLTRRSTAFRHALRLAATIGVCTALFRLLELDRGYWIGLTALLVLRPDFQDTFARGLGRIAGTILGALLATAIVWAWTPGPLALTILVLIFVWGCYALIRINYAAFTVSVTGYVVFILMLSGVGELTAATSRALYTLAGGALALAAYGIWPTWSASSARGALAALLDAHAKYIGMLMAAYADPSSLDLRRLAQLRADARLVRSNTEAVVERMLAEPPGRASLSPRTAVGLLAALRRHALAALALHAGLERGVAAPVTGMATLTAQMTAALAALATTLRSGAEPLPVPPLRETQLALEPAAQLLVGEETNLMVESINTMAELLSLDAHQPREHDSPGTDRGLGRRATKHGD